MRKGEESARETHKSAGFGTGTAECELMVLTCEVELVELVGKLSVDLQS